jgi:hypothetical protein
MDASSGKRLKFTTADFRPKLWPGTSQYTTLPASASHTATHVYWGWLVGTCLYAARRSLVPCLILSVRRFEMPLEFALRANSRATRRGKSALPQVILSCILLALLCFDRFPLSMQRHLPFCLMAFRPRGRHLPRLYFRSILAFE